MRGALPMDSTSNKASVQVLQRCTLETHDEHFSRHDVLVNDLLLASWDISIGSQLRIATAINSIHPGWGKNKFNVKPETAQKIKSNALGKFATNFQPLHLTGISQAW